MASNSANWSELHPDLLTLITGFLKTQQDLHNFRSVCRDWCLVSSPLAIQTLPFLHPRLPLTFFVDFLTLFILFSRRSYGCPLPFPMTLFATSTYLIRPKRHPPGPARAQSWVVSVEEHTRGKFRVCLPLTLDPVERLPPGFPMCLNLCDYDVVPLVASGYYVSGDNGLSVDHDNVYKVIWFENSGTVLMLLKLGSLWRAKFGCYLVVYESDSLSCENVGKFDDIVGLGSGVVYAVDRNGRVVVGRDGEDFRVECVTSDWIFSGCDMDQRKRLVVDAYGVLYLVCRDIFGGECIQLKVYRLDKEGCEWNEVDELGEKRVLFVGVDCCFFASSDDFVGCRENCIIFHKEAFPRYDLGASDSLVGEDDMQLGIGVFHLGDDDARSISSYPGLSSILWPPPLWLSPSYAG